MYRKRWLRCVPPSRPRARSFWSPPPTALAAPSTTSGSALRKPATSAFYPWWWDPNYRREVEIVEFSEQERELMHKHNLDPAQIAFRREMRANFGNRAPEEYAEDPECCFLASGDCVFDCDILDDRLKQPPAMVESSDNGKLLTFFPPVVGGNGVTPKQYIIGVDPAGGGCDGDYACAQVI